MSAANAGCRLHAHQGAVAAYQAVLRTSCAFNGVQNL